ncbi:MAG TPA: DJ-1/PfpI family protein [Asanoa sp.]|nr:DJ-1/PfpI family protein [Asanoa sp.]
MSLGQRTVVVLAYPDYQELDFWYPVLRGREEGATVHIVGPPSESILGYPVIADTAATDLDPATVDVVVLPGVVPGGRPAATDDQVALVAAVHAAGGTVAAVGNGAAVLDAAVPGATERVVTAAGTDDLAAFFRDVRAALAPA